jgi:hypothetical protein
MMLAVTRTDVLVTLHILAVVVTFGGALAYPLWFRMIRNGTPEQRAFFHGAQAKLGKFLILPGIVVVFATGAFLAGDLEVSDQPWVQIPAAILVFIGVIGAIFLGPSEEQLSQAAENGDAHEYDVVLRRVKRVTWLFIGMVVAATYMMVARTPASEDSDRAASPAQEAGCLSCHRIGSEGNVSPGGDLSTVGADMTPADIRRLLLAPPPGMPSFGDLPPDQLEDLVSYLSGLR